MRKLRCQAIPAKGSGPIGACNLAYCILRACCPGLHKCEQQGVGVAACILVEWAPQGFTWLHKGPLQQENAAAPRCIFKGAGRASMACMHRNSCLHLRVSTFGVAAAAGWSVPVCGAQGSAWGWAEFSRCNAPQSAHTSHEATLPLAWARDSERHGPAPPYFWQ